jgi:hypothetical protein
MRMCVLVWTSYRFNGLCQWGEAVQNQKLYFNDDETDTASGRGLNTSSWLRRSAGAVFGFCFGILSGFAGSILTAIAWFTGPHWHRFFIQRYGTVLLFLTIPLLIFGAQSLDLMDQRMKPPRAGVLTSNRNK